MRIPIPVAHAPFNFVPANDPIPWPIPGTEREKQPTYSGSISVQLTALEPLLVGGKQEDGQPRRFFRRDGKLCIPGSSIKGVVRSMVEALSISALGPVNARTVFFRDLNNQSYLKRFVDNESDPGISIYRSRAGYLRKRDGRWEILPCDWAKVSYQTLVNAGIRYTNQRGKPADRVRALLNDAKAVQGIGGRVPDLGDHRHPKPWNQGLTLRYRRLQSVVVGGDGRLVTAGDMQTRHFETVLYPPHTTAQPVDVQHLWDDFEEWLQQHKPRQNLLKELRSTQAAAYYKHGIPVFWIEGAGSTREKPRVGAFGFCQLFCVPYRYSVEALTGSRDPYEPLSLAERIFGFADLRVAEKGISRRGRVSCGAARCTKETRELEPRVVVPGNPSASCLGLYLQQEDPAKIARLKDNHGLRTYDDAEAQPRGRKFYWHRPRAWEQPAGPVGENDRVSARYAPIDRGAQFESSIHFDQLEAIELGALLAAIQLPKGHAHKLGLGKPFGLGSVRLEITRLDVRADADRYRSLRARAASEPTPSSRLDWFVREFEQEIANTCHCDSFEKVPEIRALRALTNYDNAPAVAATRYMPLQRPHKDDRESAVYANKPVLPPAERVGRSGAPNP
jgi:CRISPR-associated protein (TIGR03986 family)